MNKMKSSASRTMKTSVNWVTKVLIVNAVVLDILVIHQFVAKGAVLGTTSTETCPSVCISKINQMAGKTVTGTAKEYYVPLGSGTNATSDWADIAGASVNIDTASYGKLKQVTFEATVSTVGSQKLWVRLYNATDKHPVWYSEVSTGSSGPILLTSPSIILDTGNKLYQVQMKTQLKAPSTLVQSRVHIVTN